MSLTDPNTIEIRVTLHIVVQTEPVPNTMATKATKATKAAKYV